MATAIIPAVTELYVRVPIKFVLAFTQTTGYPLQFIDLGSGYAAVKIADVRDSRLFVDLAGVLLLLFIVELYKHHMKELVKMFEQAILRAQKTLSELLQRPTPEVVQAAKEVAAAVAEQAQASGGGEKKIVVIEEVASKPRVREALRKLAEKLKIPVPLFEKESKKA